MHYFGEEREPMRDAGAGVRQVYTTGQVAKMLNVHTRTVCKWVDAGRLRGYRVPGSRDRRVPREALLAFLADAGLPAPAGLAGDVSEGEVA
jgi:excisionase family DNA binding protein